MRTDATTVTAAAATSGRPLIAWLLIAPLFLWVAAFVVAPTLIMLVYSFCQRGTLGGVVFTFTLENYAARLRPHLPADHRALDRLFGAHHGICLAMGYPVAYFIGRAPERWRNLLLMLVMVPFWTSFLIRTYAWVTILKNEGLLNSLLIQSGSSRSRSRCSTRPARSSSAWSTPSCRS